MPLPADAAKGRGSRQTGWASDQAGRGTQAGKTRQRCSDVRWQPMPLCIVHHSPLPQKPTCLSNEDGCSACARQAPGPGCRPQAPPPAATSSDSGVGCSTVNSRTSSPRFTTQRAAQLSASWEVWLGSTAMHTRRDCRRQQAGGQRGLRRRPLPASRASCRRWRRCSRPLVNLSPHSVRCSASDRHAITNARGFGLLTMADAVGVTTSAQRFKTSIAILRACYEVLCVKVHGLRLVARFGERRTGLLASPALASGAASVPPIRPVCIQHIS